MRQNLTILNCNLCLVHHSIFAINKSNFTREFNVDNSGLIVSTPLMWDLKFKTGAKVALTYTKFIGSINKWCSGGFAIG